MADYRPVVINFASKGLDIHGTPDTIAIDEWTQALNWSTEYEGALNSRLGRTALASIGGDTHTLARLAARSAAYRYAGSSDKLYRAVTPFSSYSQITPGAAWTASKAYRVGDIVTPGNGHVYTATIAGISGSGSPTFPTTAAGTVSDNTAAQWVTAHVYAALAFSSNAGKLYQTTLGGTSGATVPTHTTGTVTDGTVLWTFVRISLVWTESNFSGSPLLTAAYSIGIDTKPWQIFADPRLMVKDSGTGAPSLFGIVPPASAATVATNATELRYVSTLQAAGAGPTWTEADTDAVLATTYPATAGVPSAHAYSMLCTFSSIVPIAATAYMVLDGALPLSTFLSTLAINDNDIMHIALRATDPEYIDEVALQVSIGDTSYTNYYEMPIPRSALDAAVWTLVDVARGDLLNVSNAGASMSWASVASVRIKMRVTLIAPGGIAVPCTVSFDDWKMTGGGSLSAGDYTWKYAYRNSTTGAISNPSPVGVSPTSSPARQTVTITVAQSRDPQVDFIDIYRQGGTSDAFRLTQSAGSNGSIVNNPLGADTVTYVDNVLDSLLGANLDTDNDRAPNFTGIELHNETIFGWGASDDPQNLVRFSKRVDVESFPQSYYIYVGSGSEHVIRLIVLAESLYAFTTANVYRIIGSDSTSYQAINTGFGRGINNQFAVVRSPGSIAMACFDGIYEFPSGKSLSAQIDGVFHGLTVGGILPINPAALAATRMEFYDNTLYVCYPSGTSTTNDASMVLDALYQRWMPSDQSGRALYAEFDSNKLLMAKSGGIYQLETGTTDSGGAIYLDLETKYLDLDYPGQQKVFSDMALDVNTAGETLSVQLFYDNGAAASAAVSVSNTSRRLMPLAISSGDGHKALNCQLRITGSVTSQVFVYRAIFYVLVEPASRASFQTDWEDTGYPYDKYWKEILIEADTGGGGTTVHLDIDGVNDVYQFAFAASGRRRGTLSVTRDTIGKLARLRFTGAAIKLYSHDFVVQREPADVTIADSLEQTFGYDRFKLCKRLWLSYKSTSALTMNIYADEVLRATRTIPASALSSGWAKVPFILPPTIKGKLLRFVFTSNNGTSFKIYWDTSELEWRPINQERGFARYKFQPPQLM